MDNIDILKKNIYDLQLSLVRAYKRIKDLTNKTSIVTRQWGYYEVYDDKLGDGSEKVKLKKLVVYPGKKLSMQKHKNRAELWFCAEGVADVYSLDVRGNIIETFNLTPGETVTILPEEWHRLTNNTSHKVVIIEIQYGKECEENDIERYV